MAAEYLKNEGRELVARSVHINCCGGSTESMDEVRGQHFLVIECQECHFRVVISDGDSAEAINKEMEG